MSTKVGEDATQADAVIRVYRLLEAYFEKDRDYIDSRANNKSDMIGNLLADIMLFCHAKGIAFEKELEFGFRQFHYEKE